MKRGQHHDLLPQHHSLVLQYDRHYIAAEWWSRRIRCLAVEIMPGTLIWRGILMATMTAMHFHNTTGKYLDTAKGHYDWVVHQQTRCTMTPHTTALCDWGCDWETNLGERARAQELEIKRLGRRYSSGGGIFITKPNHIHTSSLFLSFLPLCFPFIHSSFIYSSIHAYILPFLLPHFIHFSSLLSFLLTPLLICLFIFLITLYPFFLCFLF